MGRREGGVLAVRFLASLAANRRGDVPQPSWCTYLVTMRCNARCRMCDSWRLPRTPEMSPDDAARVFAGLGRLDVARLSGGEPFVRTDFAALARPVDDASRPLILHVTTNGSFSEAAEEFAASFPRPRSLRFLVSLDGTAGVHDGNRGSAVTFARAEETVRRLARLRRSGPRVSVNHTVISARSLADAPALQARFASLGVEVTTVLAYAESATYSLGARPVDTARQHPAPGYFLFPDLQGCDVKALVHAELERTRRVRDPLLRVGTRYFLRGLLSRLQGDSPPSPRPRCVALRSHLRILPDGSVPVCQFNGEVMGNLRVTSPDEVLHSSAANTARRWVDACPGCWAECEAVPNAIYTGDIVRGIAAQKVFAPSSNPRFIL